MKTSAVRQLVCSPSFILLLAAAALCSTLFPAENAFAGRIYPLDLEYRGAFRLPGPDGEAGWAWGGHALAYYPGGDPNGSADGYPGSLFGTGHDWYQRVSEISIPVPVISPDKDLSDLNTAVTLQPFTDIRSLLFGEFEIPYCGLEYLPAGGGRLRERLYFGWHQHLQISPHWPTHGWCELDLSQPLAAGPWYIGNYDTYSTTDYLFSIPQSWADAYVGGKCLATGRMRDGGQGGQGPCIYVIAPWQAGNPPAPGAVLAAAPLLQYSTAYWDDPQGGAYAMDRYHHSDLWPGAAWLTAGGNLAVIFAGTKGRGDCWYGNQDGPCLECDNRGWWSTFFDGEIIFYDPADLAAVAAGTMEPYEPQPYAVMNIDDLLYHVSGAQQKSHVAAAAVDREHGYLYVFEPLVDDDKPIVHVWKVQDNGGLPTPPPVPTRPPGPTPTPVPLPENLVLRSGDYDGDGIPDIAIYRPETGLWAIRGKERFYFGAPGDVPASGDYDDDGTTDLALFRPSPGLWIVRGITRFYIGTASDRPVPADYNGDGFCDPALFRPVSGLWAVPGVTRTYYGGEGDLPVPGDYDGDGTDDIGIFRDETGLWALRGAGRIYFGKGGDRPVPGDYNGDGVWSPAVFRPGTGLWAVRGLTRIYFGASLDRAVPADYNGDASDDAGIWRGSSGLWAIRGISRVYYGSSNDMPVTR
ncbi:MAG: hypothetical protein V1789_12650 [PVC group bacterium]